MWHVVEGTKEGTRVGLVLDCLSIPASQKAYHTPPSSQFGPNL